MDRSRRLTPPFSPVLLAGLAARPLPPAALRPALALAVRILRRRHPGLFDRLKGVGAPSFLIDPIDLPFVFLLETDPERPRLTALSGTDAAAQTASATIRGPLMMLVDLAEGRLDGDALFFSRDLVVEGDTEAVVALRNAVDDSEIDLTADLASMFGPLAGPARLTINGLAALVSRAAGDLETLREAVIAPAVRRTEAQAAELRELEERMESAGGGPGRTRRAPTPS
ncbi:MAG: SCP2 sterol-binding domain-containing protein [Rhodospirillales bacterium]|jgi:predicted lipid carrier protein YhbT|nr:SCP2 sterol-binding domain-containing protein [Rhodospirillales bacterium]